MFFLHINLLLYILLLTDVVDTLDKFEQNLVQCLFCFRVINLSENILRHYIFGVTLTMR